MMAAKRTEYAPPGGDRGLIFDWRTRRTPTLGKLGLIALAAGLFLLPWMVIRIQIGRPPVQDHRSAAIMMLTPGADPMHWMEAARDLGPFPTRFDPAEWPQSRALVASVLESTGRAAPPALEPQFQDLPEHAAVDPIPLIAKGSRILPPVAPPPVRPVASPPVRLAPRIYPLTAGEDALPAARPRFEAAVTPEMASQPWRFLLQVAPDGGVLYATALIGQNTPGRADLCRWLEAHRFPPHSGLVDRWVAVALTFQNQPVDGADDR